MDDDRRHGPDRREGSDGLPYAWLYSELTSLRELVTDQHQRIRSDMANGFASVRADFKAHEDEDRKAWLKIHDIEQREKNAAETVTKRNMAASGIIAAIIGPGAAYLFRKFFG